MINYDSEGVPSASALCSALSFVGSGLCSPMSTFVGLLPFSCCGISISGADAAGGIVSSAMLLEVGPESDEDDRRPGCSVNGLTRVFDCESDARIIFSVRGIVCQCYSKKLRGFVVAFGVDLYDVQSAQ